MNRRELLQGMLAASAAGFLGGCRHRFAGPFHSPSSKEKLLGVVLHGPWGVVMRKNKGYRINAFVPKTDKDDVQHEFRFLSPQNPTTYCESGYRFVLLRDGLDTTVHEPFIDRGFDNVRFSVNEWNPDYGHYFVSLELPTPQAIGYVPPLYPVLFESGKGRVGRPGYAPLNHVLEYRIRHADDVRLRPQPSPHCPIKSEKQLQDHHPLSLEEISAKYRAYHQQMPDQGAEPGFSQRPHIFQWLERYDYVFFLGVGVPPEQDPSSHMRERMDHGVRFFNQKLLPAIFQRKEPPEGSKLLKIGREALPYGTGQADARPSLTSAVWRYPMQRPQLRYVVSHENCSAPAATATAGS